MKKEPLPPFGVPTAIVCRWCGTTKMPSRGYLYCAWCDTGHIEVREGTNA